MEKAVAAIVVGTNEKRWLRKAFETLLLNEHAGRLEIIYVDNNSRDGSIEIVRRHFPTIHIIRSAINRGYSGANNLGIQFALQLKVDYLFLLNPDTASPRELIPRLVTFMETHPDFGAIGPLQSVYGEGQSLNEWSRHALENGDRHVFHMHIPGPRHSKEPTIPNVLEHAYVQGAALFLRSTLFSPQNWFDPTYQTFYEEVDLCRRIRWLGYRVGLITDLFIEHQGGGESFYRKKLMMRNKYYYVLTDPTLNRQQIVQLFQGWFPFDLRKDFGLACKSLLWILGHLPKAWWRRMQNRKTIEAENG